MAAAASISISVRRCKHRVNTRATKRASALDRRCRDIYFEFLSISVKVPLLTRARILMRGVHLTYLRRVTCSRGKGGGRRSDHSDAFASTVDWCDRCFPKVFEQSQALLKYVCRYQNLSQSSCTMQMLALAQTKQPNN